MTPIVFKDDVLLYGLTRYFGLNKGTRRGSGGTALAALLLTLYRIKGPVRRDVLMEAAGMGHCQPITFRAYIHFLRAALGHDAIYLNKWEWQLSFEARREMDKAFVFIQAELEEAIRPKARQAVLAMESLAD